MSLLAGPFGARRRSVIASHGGVAVAVTGGTVTEPGDGYRYHELADGETLVVNEEVTVDYLVVGGGGAGGRRQGGGGGAGRVVKVLGATLPVGNYPVTVGAGGTDGGVSGGQGNSGAASSFNGQTAPGGGGGGGRTGPFPGLSGGSGGGGANFGAGGSATAGSPVSGSGSTGGNSGYSQRGGGGGGAAAGGQNTTSSSSGGNGGNGIAVSEFSQFGEAGVFGGGGGGGAFNNTNGIGGTGGGGDGGDYPGFGGDGPRTGEDGVDGTGSGGGGSSDSGDIAGAGGDGTVIVRYLSGEYAQFIASASSDATLPDVASVTLTKPAAVQEGDLLVAVISHRWGIGGITHPSGWTEVSEVPVPANWQWGALAYKVAGPSEPASYQWDGAVTDNAHVGMWVLRNPEGGKLVIEDWVSTSIGTDTSDADDVYHNAGSLVAAGAEQRVMLNAVACGWSGGAIDYDEVGGTLTWGALTNTSIKCIGSYAEHTGAGDVTQLNARHDGVSHDATGFAVLVAGRESSYDGPVVLDQPVTHVGGEGNATNTTTLTLDIPDTAQEGDVAIAAVACLNGSATLPSGWTNIDYADRGNGNDFVRVCYKVLGAGETGSVSFSIGGSNDAAGVLGVLRGVGAFKTYAVGGGPSTPPAACTEGGVEVHIATTVWSGQTYGYDTWSSPMRMLGIAYEDVGLESVLMGWRYSTETGTTTPAAPTRTLSSDTHFTVTFEPA